MICIICWPMYDRQVFNMWHFRFLRRRVWGLVFWDVAPCSQVYVTDVSEVRTASITHRRDDGGSTHLRNVGQHRLHGVTSPKTLNFNCLLNNGTYIITCECAPGWRHMPVRSSPPHSCAARTVDVALLCLHHNRSGPRKTLTPWSRMREREREREQKVGGSVRHLDRRLVWLWWCMLMPIGMPC
jgi:hypothetical protein